MQKRVFIVAGAAIGFVTLIGLSLLAGFSVVRAAAHTEENRALLAPAVASQQAVTSTEKGAVVVAVDMDSPAAKAGVKRGDILLKIDDKDVSTPADVKTLLADKKAGDTVKLTVMHGDDERTLTATLTDRNGQPYLGLAPFGGRSLRYGGFEMWHGFGKPFTSNSIFTQVMVVEVISGSPAAKAGIVKGDLITTIDGKQLNPDTSLSDAIAGHKPGDTVTLEVTTPGQNARQLKVQLGENPDKAGVAYLGVRYMMGPHMRMEKRRRGDMFPMPGMPFTNTLEGAVIRSVTAGSPAEKAGLKAGDIVRTIDGKSLQSPQDLVSAITAHKPGDQITLGIQPATGSQTNDVKITLGDNPDKKGTAYLGVSVSGGMRFRMDRIPGQQGMPGLRAPGRFFNQQPSQQQTPSGSTL